MQYLNLAQVYEKLSKTSKRLDKTAIIAELFKQAPEADLSDISLLAQGRLFPSYDQTEIGVASKLVVRAISLATGEDKAKVEQSWAKIGDLGLVTERLVAKKSQTSLFSENLTVKKVTHNLRKLATIEGLKSVDHKLKIIAELLTNARPLEAKYIIRTTLGDLRIGIGDGTVRDAIALAFFPEISEAKDEDRESYKILIDEIQQAYDVSNDFGQVASLAKHKGREGFGEVSMTPGKPLKVMLAQKVASAEEGLERVGIPAAIEFKYDGFRLQIHKHEDRISLFTRRLENVTKQFPDVIDSVKNHVSGSSFIIDCEAIGYDPRTKHYLPFQHVSQRIRRKYDIEELVKQLPIELNVFDCLYFDGKSLLKQPYTERRAIIEKMVKPVKHRIQVAEQILVEDPIKLNSFYQSALDAGQEGVMLKKLDAIYKPGSRVGYMVKLKPVMESMDLVIVGAEWGEGKRAEWFTSFTLACRDDDGEFLEIGKVGTGIKELEEQGLTFSQLTEKLRPVILQEKGREVKIKPHIVVEVKFEEIQKSPTYSSGFALRFPRVIRLRDDRCAEDVNTLEEVKEYFYSQN
ncbi:MAG: ATP-dependent DNA ligase [Nanoarchaeota archaeon]